MYNAHTHTHSRTHTTEDSVMETGSKVPMKEKGSEETGSGTVSVCVCARAGLGPQ